MTKHHDFDRILPSDRRLLMPEPQRVLPVSLHPEILRRVLTGRVRLIHRPDRRYARLQPGDMLWVRKGLTIPTRQPGGDTLSVVYGGDGTHRDIRWPRAIARPQPGWLPAQAMPVHASRLTLVVTSVTELRLQQITEEAAIAAGVELEAAGGFGNPLVHGHHSQVFPHASEAFGRMWDCALGPEAIGPHRWTVNPEVVAIGFRAIARNVVRLFPGLGSGGRAMRKQSFSTETMQHLMTLGLSQVEVAQRLGVTRGAIIARMKREGLTWPARHSPPAAQRARSAALTPAEDRIALTETGGRYVDLCDWARRRGLTHTQALQRWHRMGIPAKARRS